MLRETERTPGWKEKTLEALKTPTKWNELGELNDVKGRKKLLEEQNQPACSRDRTARWDLSCLSQLARQEKEIQ
ncbi:hypothetical protein NDU88_002161 [Pleurodeles waltl]|uniref:Uncharacterized protein n=1 Tax=Pleurodeles waltl TaxID=8319 RepID=A0AAV7PAV0_PLEWA|nr:hypothetical protein NDU88_002161 [Pleurodeles waltl]